MFPGSGNTNVVHHAGSIWAINELSLPYEISTELDTIRRYDFGGPLPAGTTAHPKFDPATGDLHVMAYNFVEPYLWYHVVDASGQLVRSESIDVGGPVMVHDMGLTETRVVVFDLPVVFNLERAMQGVTFPYEWSDDYTPRVGLLPRAGTAADTVWIEVDPCYVFHPLNAYDDGRLGRDRPGAPPGHVPHGPAAARTTGRRPSSAGRSTRWRARSAPTGSTTTPRSSPGPTSAWPVGRHRYGYSMGAPVSGLAGTTDASTSVLKHDVVAGTTVGPRPRPGPGGRRVRLRPGHRRRRRGRGLADGLRVRPGHRHERSGDPRRPRHGRRRPWPRCGWAAGCRPGSTATGSPIGRCTPEPGSLDRRAGAVSVRGHGSRAHRARRHRGHRGHRRAGLRPGAQQEGRRRRHAVQGDAGRRSAST